MKDHPSILIAGAGAIGSMVAGEIHKKVESAVSILAGGERLRRYRKESFIINGEKTQFDYTDVNTTTEPDLVIIACKYHQLTQVITDLNTHIGEKTLILSLLNGISSEKVIGEAFGPERIPYAMIIGTDAGHVGNRTTFSSPGTIFFGDGTNSTDKNEWSFRVRTIASIFEHYGINYCVPENMLNRLWYKFMLNVGVNQTTAIMRRPYRIFKKGNLLPETKELLDASMREVITIAAAEGITLTEDDIQNVYTTLDALTDEGKTSMYQDIEAGRKTEVELFSGTICELGKKHGIPVPVNTILYRLLRTIEQSYS